MQITNVRYDGVSGTTQCPIPPKKTFTYKVDTAEQSGTTWYHAHTRTQYIDGFSGPLIVHDKNDPHLNSYDEEMIVFLQDWYHEDSVKLNEYYLRAGGNGDEVFSLL